MGRVKSFLIIFAMAICGFLGTLTISTPAYAEDACDVAGYTDPLLCGTKRTDEETALLLRIKAILNTVYLWVGILAIIFIVVGGVKYMTSAGSPEQIKGAKNTILYALIGLFVAIAAFAITYFVIGALEGSTYKEPVSVDDPSTPGSESRDKARAISVVSRVTVVAGQKAKIKARVVPDYAKNQSLTYAIADDQYATIDQEGNIKAKKAGETTITVTSPDGPSKTIPLIVQQPVAVKSISLSDTSVEVRKKKTVVVTARVLPQNAADKTLGWESEDPKIATVTQTGKITGIKEGTTTVHVYARNKLTFAYMPTSDTVLAANIEEIKNSPTVKKAKIKVTVPTDTWEIADVPSTERKYSKNGKFTPTTQKIVNAHKSDFNCKTFKSFMKKQGGYTAYVKSLGGIFTNLAGKKITIKTAADFQAVAEYVYGLWTIWGPDYNNWYKSSCSGCHYVNWAGSDAFYSKCPNLRGNGVGYKVGYAKSKKIDTVLSESKAVRTHCNGSVDIMRKSIANTFTAGSANPSTLINKGGKKITEAKNLQVGDIMAYFQSDGWHHTAIVGEVYKDYVVLYDGGSTTQKKNNWKRVKARTNSAIGGGWSRWYAVRVYNLDQTKTLKGLE